MSQLRIPAELLHLLQLEEKEREAELPHSVWLVPLVCWVAVLAQCFDPKRPSHLMLTGREQHERERQHVMLLGRQSLHHQS